MARLRAYWSEMDHRKKRILKPIIGVVLGGALGYAYYATGGCATGGCPITSDPWISTFWGAAIGAFATA
jgi:hypothetical protein